MAAEVISRCIKNDDVSAEALSEYNGMWWEARGGSLKRVEKLRHVIEKLSDKELDMLADSVDGNTMVELSRGNKMKTLAKVLMKRPSLIRLARHLL
jgi:digeranylgeranylglycerophospholipid reductase